MARPGFTNIQRFMRLQMANDLVDLEDNINGAASNLANLVDSSDSSSDDGFEIKKVPYEASTSSHLDFDERELPPTPESTMHNFRFVPPITSTPLIAGKIVPFSIFSPDLENFHSASISDADKHQLSQFNNAFVPGNSNSFAFVNRRAPVFTPEILPEHLSPQVISFFGLQSANSMNSAYKETLEMSKPEVIQGSGYFINPAGSATNFHKKYPRRSQKGFDVVPKLDLPPPTNEKIDLRVLNIGPKCLYYSEQKKISLMLDEALTMLRFLEEERVDIEAKILNINGRHFVDFKEDTFDPSSYKAYKFQAEIASLIEVACKEYSIVIFTFLNLETLCSNNIPDFEPEAEGLLKVLRDAIQGLHRLLGLTVIKTDGFLDASKHPQEVQTIKEVLFDFIEAVQRVASCMWAQRILFERRQR